MCFKDQNRETLIRISDTGDFPLMDVPDVIALEKQIEASGTSLLMLMKRAGTAITELIKQMAADKDRIVVLAGNGNNGGDGWVAARLLAESGYSVDLLTAKDPYEIAAEPARQAVMEIMDSLSENLKIHVSPCSEIVKLLVNEAAIIIDALLGTGFNGDSIKEPFATWIEWANNSEACIVSADVPSGLSAQNGSHAEPTVAADSTVTMLAVKPGLIDDSALPYVGDLYLAELMMKIDDNLIPAVTLN